MATPGNAPPPGTKKVLHLMRHGTTEMNVYLADRSKLWGKPGFVDPLMYDSKLTAEGRDGAVAASSRVEQLQLKPQLLVVSPLRRTVETAVRAWPSYRGPVAVEALARERLWVSADVGRAPAELAKEAPDGRFDYSHLPDIWWYNGGSSDPLTVLQEPKSVYEARIRDFKAWLLARPETCIAVVSHWNTLHELTGHSFRNCELQSFVLDPAQDPSDKLCYWIPNSRL